MQTYVQRKTEQKKKQFTVYSSVYVYIYIYIFIFKLPLFLVFEPLNFVFHFSHVNLQLKVGANEDELVGIWVLAHLSASAYFVRRGKKMTDCSNKSYEKHRLWWQFFFFIIFSEQRGSQKRAHSAAIRDTRHMIFCLGCYC